jgi:hypothetical protein
MAFAEAREKKVLGVGGGCKGLKDAQRLAMFDTLASALTRPDGTCYGGVLLGGGTKTSDAMVTQIPARIANMPGFEGVVAMSHIPRTDIMSVGPRGLDLDDGGDRRDFTHVDPDADATLIVQQDVNTSTGWNGDVVEYLSWETGARDMAGYVIGNIYINGGDITRDDEIYGGLLLRIPTIVLDGSARESDAFCAAFNRGDWSLTAAELRGKKGDAVADAAVARAQTWMGQIDRSLVRTPSFTNADEIRQALIDFNML